MFSSNFAFGCERPFPPSQTTNILCSKVERKLHNSQESKVQYVFIPIDKFRRCGRCTGQYTEWRWMLFSSSSDQKCLCHLGKRSWIDDPELGQFFKERSTSKRQKATFDDCHSRNTWLWKVCWFRDTGIVLTGCRLFGLSIGKLASAFARYYNKKSLLFLALFLIIVFSTGWIPFLIGTTSLISQPSDAQYRRGAPDTFDSQSLLHDLTKIRYGEESSVALPL